jgi:hypothetical protein
MRQAITLRYRKCRRRNSHPPILRTTDCMAEFVIDPGNDGRIKIILSSGIDLDPGARVQEMILVATIDRPKESGAAMIALLPPLAVDCRSEQQPAFYAALAGQETFPGKTMFVIIIKRKDRG